MEERSAWKRGDLESYLGIWCFLELIGIRGIGYLNKIIYNALSMEIVYMLLRAIKQTCLREILEFKVFKF